MTWWEALAILAAGMGAGMINAVVGSGSLITFPTLVALGYPPLLSNVSNNIGLVPGSVTAVYGYRRELVGQRARLTRLVPASLLGASIGSTLLLVLPSDVFDGVVVVLVILALVLVVTGPRISRWVARRRGEGHPGATNVTFPLMAVVAAAGVYGGYFGAAQGIILTATLGVFLDDHLQRLNACKNVLAGSVNAVAAVVFIASTDVDWKVVGMIAVGSTIGGWLGARYGRRLDPRALRAVIVVVGLVALVRLLT
ncbi:MAG: sulfite exporter TauE/SafE family protein [Acidimicrobiaceae bacterium]|nr:sulfite exporter TauE/SafE family protein [Ilumatobacter sp.]MCB9379149.1 sulfite exporter TauE/SafE family protein [Acidimicrobiaceae bacterium]MCO5330560.1 sulfite exporter TauE/SafE family protein [Ilumatobacteraceae bacterium]